MGYYRALFNPTRYGLPEAMEEQGAVWGRPVPQPVLYIHGTTDGCIALDAELMKQALSSSGRVLNSNALRAQDISFWLRNQQRLTNVSYSSWQRNK